MRRLIPRLGVLAVLLVALPTLTACGSDDDASTSAKTKPNGVDRAFVADMIVHHRTAVEMAEVARTEGESDFVRTLADDIARTQNEEISVMRRADARLAEAGIRPTELGVAEHMKGMDGDAAELRGAEPFDEAFIELMVPHHEGAIEMAKAELAQGGDRQLKDLAQRIILAQEREVREMREHQGGGAMEGEHGGGHAG